MGRAIRTLLVAATVVFSGVTVEAGYIGDACIRANRPSASRDLCTCIDKVAKKTLSRSERRRGAKLFKNPHEAQRVRQSSRKSDEAFWDNWKAFGESASKTCG